MFPARTVTAKNSADLLDKFRAIAFAQRGGSPSSPGLQNGMLLQLADYYKQHRQSGYHSLARIALGFFKEGDKFQAAKKFSTRFARAGVPAKVLPILWSRMAVMSAAIDAADKGASAQYTPTKGDAHSFWDMMATAAFKQLQLDRAARRGGSAAPPTRRIPRKIPKVKPPPGIGPGPDGAGGEFLIVVLLVVALAAASK